MSYGRILKPRVYACHAAHLALRGTAPGSIVSIVSNNLQPGFDVRDLIAMRPQAQTGVDCGGETTHVRFAFDLQAARTISFVALLNHNLWSADCSLRVAHNGSAFGAAEGQGTEVSTTTMVGSVDAGTGRVISNGSHLLTFAPTSARYWSIEMEDVSTFNSDFALGSILIGSYWDAPYAPDLQVRRRLMHDGVKINETRGGKRHASIGWLTGSEGTNWYAFGAPFRTDAVDTIYEHHTGRRQYEMTFSRLADTAVEEEDFSEGILGDGTATAKWRDIMSLTGAGALPSIFTPDGTSTTSGDYLFARVEPGDETQVAPKVWTVSATISEEF